MGNIHNPFTKLKLKYAVLLIITAMLFLSIPFIYYFLNNKFNSDYSNTISENYFLEKKVQENNQTIEHLNKELIKKEEKLKKLTMVNNIIKNYIVQKNPLVSERVAEQYALKISKESLKNGNSPYIQTALLSSESSFFRNPKHDIKTVIGMGGIYWDVWSKDLKKEGICYNIEDLRNPLKNIEASSYVLNTYMETSKTPREALAHYKGYCKLGKKQADDVMMVAMKLKEKEKAYYETRS